MKKAKKLNLKIIFIAFGTVVLSLSLLLGGIFAIPKLAEFLRNNRVDEPNDESKNEIIERKELVYDGNERYRQIKIGSYGSVIAVSEHFKIFRSEKPSSFEANGNRNLNESEYKYFDDFSEGYTVDKLSQESWEKAVETVYAISKAGGSYYKVSIKQTTWNSIEFYLDKWGGGFIADDWELWTVIDDGFFGFIIDEHDGMTERCNLYVHDGEYMYVLKSEDVGREELVKLYFSFNPLWVDSSYLMVEKDIGLPGDFKSYPIGLFNGYIEYFAKGFTLICDSENNLETVTSHSVEKCILKEERPSVFPSADGHEVYKLSDWEYIYKKDGLDAFKYTVSGVKFEHEGKIKTGNVRHIIRFSGSDAALYTVMVGKIQGFLFTNGNYSELFWADGEYDYSLESYNADYDGVKLLALAKSCEEREVLTAEYKSFYSNDYTVQENKNRLIKFEVDFRDNKNNFIMRMTSESSGSVGESVYVHMYDNLDDIPRMTINETAGDDFYAYAMRDYQKGVIYEVVISRDAFRLSDEMIVQLGAKKVLKLTFDGQNINVEELNSR